MNDDENYSSEFFFATDLNRKRVTARKLDRVGSRPATGPRSLPIFRAVLNTPRQ